ncbi:MAG: hypothetical protein Q9191_001345 [Dirinaria sp. TL-2023a]
MDNLGSQQDRIRKRASNAYAGRSFFKRSEIAIPTDHLKEFDVGQPHRLPTPANGLGSNEYAHSDSEIDSRRESTAIDEDLTNPLVSGKSVYVADSTGQPSESCCDQLLQMPSGPDKKPCTAYLGTSSNWSFGRRILSNAHERLYGVPLPAASHLFQGPAYELGWDGRRGTAELDDAILPTADFALFLINAVKFHCGQLFHLFDEQEFMRNFSTYHDQGHRDNCSELWHIHYLLILALGKAFIVRVGQNRRPPGANLFVQAMRLLPDTTYLCNDPIPSIEILCCAALYFQCSDMRDPAYSLVSSVIAGTMTR